MPARRRISPASVFRRLVQHTAYGLHQAVEIDGFVQVCVESGGQALLTRAFLHYYQASYEQNLDKKHEQMFLANCYAILHEHIRLEPYIQKAMPRLLRREVRGGVGVAAHTLPSLTSP